jgi:hypothetical protein
MAEAIEVEAKYGKTVLRDAWRKEFLFDFGLLFAVTQRAEGPSRPHHTSSRHTWSNNNYRICNSVGVSPKMHPEISPVS